MAAACSDNFKFKGSEVTTGNTDSAAGSNTAAAIADRLMASILQYQPAYWRQGTHGGPRAGGLPVVAAVAAPASRLHLPALRTLDVVEDAPGHEAGGLALKHVSDTPP
jgi:hypothetical protein